MPEHRIEDNRPNDGTAVPLPEIVPRPSVWPACMSLAVTALAFGVVTSWIMCVSGSILFLISAYGWFEDIRNDGR